jgi:universal protein Kae1
MLKGRENEKSPSESYCLGIESTADDFGIGIATFTGDVIANAVDSFMPEMGGIHPREAARHHAFVADKVLKQALEKAGIRPDEISIIAFSQGPGLGPCLRTGATVARALASYLSIPLVGVHHSLAHVEIGRLTNRAVDPLTLYVSGGNTIVAAYDSGRYRVFGETLDIALGNCLDVFARCADLKQRKELPLGAALEECALRGRKLVELPYTVKGMDISLSGLLTAACNCLEKGVFTVEDLCYSLQENSFSMVTEVTERALAHTEKKEVLLTGGVAANIRLQSMVKAIAEEHNAQFSVVPKSFATDNGAMIAWTGVLDYMHGITTAVEKSYVKLRWRLDEVDVPWMK